MFLGILFSLGSSTAIANMVAGIVLTYSRAFRIGDRVKVGDTFGDVVEKSFLTTRIRTPKNEDVSVPNAAVLSNHIVNYSVMAREGSGVVLHTTVTIGYDVPWPQVHRLLIGAARDTAGVVAEPAPFVLQTSLGDFSVAYQLNAYTHEVTRMARTYSDIHQHIQDGSPRPASRSSARPTRPGARGRRRSPTSPRSATSATGRPWPPRSRRPTGPTWPPRPSPRRSPTPPRPRSWAGRPATGRGTGNAERRTLNGEGASVRERSSYTPRAGRRLSSSSFVIRRSSFR